MSSDESDPDSSGRETSGSPSPPPQSTSIFEAMNTSPCVKLRQLLRTIWTEHPPARNTIDSTLRGSMNSSGTLKRKAFEKCKNCDEAYDVDCNTMGACRYHPEGMEVDDESDVWADHDPEGHGDPRLASFMEDPAYEDGYLMSCCEKRPYSLGCVISRHKPRYAGRGTKQAKR